MAAQTYVFKAALVGVRGVSRKLALPGGETLADLHAVLRQAFGWDDDHLYSFWLSGKFWDREPGNEFASPWLDGEVRTADVQLDRLGLVAGQKIAYVFDYGDEWRVLLTVAEIRPAERREMATILESRGDAPPQYGAEDDELTAMS